MVVAPTPEFFAPYGTWQAWGVLGGGLLITALLVGYLISMINHATKIEGLATDLSKANEELESEIVERKRAEEALTYQAHLLENVNDAVISSDERFVTTAWNRAAEEMYGWTAEEVIGRPTVDFLQPEFVDVEPDQVFRQLLEGGHFEGQVIHRRKDGTRIQTEARARALRDKDGRITGFVSIDRDITERRQAEDKIRASLQEKEVLLKEINHRVKNNLQIISSLLNLQSRDIQDKQALRSFQVSQDRIKAMALVHEKLYQSEDLARIDFGEYIKSLATDLGSSYGLGSRNIEVKLDVENILLGVDTAIPCGVIVNELVTNSLKHAFPGDRSGEISITFREVDGQYTMVFKDDGVGLPEDLDISHPSSLGLTIVNALTGQLGGAIALGRNGGSEVSITFPVG